MAEDSDLEKTESASPRRLEKAREEGDVPRSRELATFVVLTAAATGLWITGESLIRQIKHLLTLSLTFNRDQLLDDHARLLIDWGQRLFDLVLAFMPLIGLLLLAALMSPLLIGGWLFHGKAVAPDFSRLSPMRGLGNMLSKRSLTELFKAIAKTLVVGLGAWWLISSQLDEVLSLGNQSIHTSAAHHGQLLMFGFVILVCTLAVIAAFDAPYQVWQYSHKLMMTRQELRDEAKESEGNPEIKAKIRSQQRAMARRRMMAQVPTADVVVTNPNHYAVALRYPEEGDHAPLVVAKGADELAQRIREIAIENGVPLVEAPPLARALYRHTELDHEIPAPLYTAVAQILAYVYQLRVWKQRGGQAPVRPQPVPLPPGMDPLEAGTTE